MDIQTGGLNAIGSRVALSPKKLLFMKEEKRRLFKSFWQEIKIRCSLDDISGDILVQLGKLMFNAAFPANKEKQQLDDMEE